MKNNRLYGQSALAIEEGKILTLVSGIGNDYTFLIYGADGKLLKNLSTNCRFANILEETLVLSKAKDSLYFVYNNSKFDRDHYLVAMNLKDYNMSNSMRLAGAYVRYAHLFDNSFLLLAGDNIQVLDLTCRKVVQQCDVIGFINAFHYEPSRKLLFGGGDQEIQAWLIADPIFCIRSFQVANEVSALGYHEKRQLLIAGQKNGEIRLTNIRTLEPTLSLYPIDSGNFILTNREGYYYSTKNSAPNYISYRSENRHYLFSQFDHQLNRPDLIARNLYDVSAEELALLDEVAEQRLNYRQQEPILNQAIVPLKIVDRYKIPIVVSDATFKYTVDLRNLQGFSKLVVHVNGSYDQEQSIGQSVAQPIEVKLNAGLNTIRVYASSSEGNRSSIEELRVIFRPQLKPPSRLFYVGIGVNTYAKAPEQQLSYAVEDIHDLDSLFRASSSNVVIKTYIEGSVTKSIISEVKDLLATTTVEDKVIIAFSGHGVTDQKKQLYFATSDIDFSNPAIDGIAYKEIEKMLKHTPARKKLLVIDACYSGEFYTHNPISLGTDVIAALKEAKAVISRSSEKLPKDKIELMKDMFADMFTEEGTVILSAARGTGVALEDQGLGNSTFTYFLKKALSENSIHQRSKDPADSNEDGLSINELKNYVLRKVSEQTHGRQQPTTRMENVSYDWKIWE